MPKGWFGRSMAMLVGGTAASQLILALSSPLLTRLYTPADFGVLGVYTALVLLLGVTVGLGYMIAIPLPEEEGDAANVVVLSLVVGAVMSAGYGVLSVVFGQEYADLMNVPELGAYMWLVPFGLMGSCVYLTLYHWSIRAHGFSVIARTKVNQAVARVGVQVVLGVAGVAPFGLLLGDLAGSTMGSGSFVRLLRHTIRESWPLVTTRAIRRLSRRYVRFVWYSTPANLLNALSIQGVPLLIAYAYGASTAGWYSLTFRVVALPMTLIGVAVGEMYFGVAPRLARDDPAALSALFKKTAKKLFLVGIGPTVILLVAGPFLFSIIFGEDWAMSGVYARYLAPALLAQLVVSPLTQTVSVLERQDLQLWVTALRTGLVFAAFIGAFRSSWSAETAIAAFSVLLLASYLVLFVIYWSLVKGLVARAAQSPPAAGGT